MGVLDTLNRGREMAEARMLDTCRITAPGVGQGNWNPTAGSYDPPAATTVYEGKCRLRASAQVNPFPASDSVESWQVEESVLSLPVVGTEAVGSGMTVEYLTAAYDQALVGRFFGIVGPHHESQATARRLLVKETVGT